MYSIIYEKALPWKGCVRINNKKYDVDNSEFNVPIIKCELNELDSCIEHDYFPEEVGFQIESASEMFGDIHLYKSNDKILLSTYYSINSLAWKEKWSPYHFLKRLAIKFNEKNIYNGRYTPIYDDAFIIDIEVLFSDIIPIQKKILTFLHDMENTHFYLYNEMLSEDNFYNISLPLSKLMHTSFKQYLLFFVDFVSVSKGKQIEVKVESTEKAVELMIENNIKYEEVSLYLQEYLNFIRINIDSLNPVIENNLSNVEKDILIVDLKNQIRHLQSSLEIKNIQFESLNESVDKFYTLLLEEKRNPKPSVIHITNEVAATANAKINSSVKNDLAKLMDDFYTLKEILSNVSENTDKELVKIDDDLLNIDEKDSKSIRENRRTFKRLKRILNQINSPGSILNQTVKASQNTIEIAKKLATTYNMIATYLGLEKIIDFLK